MIVLPECYTLSEPMPESVSIPKIEEALVDLNKNITLLRNVHTRILDLIRIIWGDGINYLILKFLCNTEVASIRETARHVGMSHKNLIKYLDSLVKKDVIEVSYSSTNIRLYRISKRAGILRKMLM
jgi:predicted transcriptional regulator